VVLHVHRSSSGARRLTQIGVVTRDEHGRVTIVPAWSHDTGEGPSVDRLRHLCSRRGPVDSGTVVQS